MKSGSQVIGNRAYSVLYLFIGIVYLAGMFLKLMENDAAQFAMMALRMHQMNDYIDLIKGSQEYLDKPHMHFWLSAFSYRIFGVHDWAYRIPSILFTLLGAYSTFGLGRLLYNRETGKLAALVFLTSQAIILANHDVRTDSVLTGATIFSIWQLASYINTKRFINMAAGAAGLAVAFSTKGQIGVFVAGTALLCHIIYTRRWKVIWSWKIPAGILIFLIVSFPMFYAYYQQFDLHPEKLVNGSYGNSGVLFILWGQSVARLTGNTGMKENADFFFFHHSFLWAFLPWSLIAIFAIFTSLKRLFRIRFRYSKGYEFLTVGGLLITFHVMSLASFKLPHYINILFPLFSLITAWYIQYLFENRKEVTARRILIAQYVIVAVCLILLVLLSAWVFPVDNLLLGIVYLLMLGALFYLIFRRSTPYAKIVLVSAWLILLVNFVLNTNHYPKLTRYQGGSEIAAMAEKEGIGVENIYQLNDQFSRSLDFYTHRFTPSISPEEIRLKKAGGGKVLIFGYDAEKRELEEAGIHFKVLLSTPHFHITTLTGTFLNPATRKQALKHAYLMEIR